jgi:hypothetical protein
VTMRKQIQRSCREVGSTDILYEVRRDGDWALWRGEVVDSDLWAVRRREDPPSALES